MDGFIIIFGVPKTSLSKLFIVIYVVVLGVVVLGMEVGDEVVWDVVVRKQT